MFFERKEKNASPSGRCSAALQQNEDSAGNRRRLFGRATVQQNEDSAGACPAALQQNEDSAKNTNSAALQAHNIAPWPTGFPDPDAHSTLQSLKR